METEREPTVESLDRGILRLKVSDVERRVRDGEESLWNPLHGGRLPLKKHQPIVGLDKSKLVFADGYLCIQVWKL